MIRYALPFLLITTQAAAEPGVCRALDGDSYVCSDERIRLENADTPELHGRCQRETNLANQAKVFAQAAIDNAAQVVITIHQRRPKDRYGRTLAKVSIDGHDLGVMLIEAGLARA
ncbi:MAG: thermonuclease family protein, partial [Ignavibacteria bacterium]|nr:thermonuclease family protein [Ignavibacteria bacterium]